MIEPGRSNVLDARPNAPCENGGSEPRHVHGAEGATPQPAGELKSYTSTRLGLAQRALEYWHLYHQHASDINLQADILVSRMQRMERIVHRQFGHDIEGLKILDIGPGQKLRQLRYLSVKNEVTGIDLDRIAIGFDPIGYLTMLRQNGPVRVAKTLGRKALGLDRRFDRHLRRTLGVRRFEPARVLQMDATDMRFPDASFDMVYSCSVFEHLPNPAATLREVNRVLKPGGLAVIYLHLYTSDNGCHDPRIFSGRRGDLPAWPHLRPAYAPLVQPNAYLNRLRLRDWDALFGEQFSGYHVEHFQHDNEVLVPELRRLRRAGELQEYSDEELLTVDYAVFWQKPTAGAPGNAGR